MHPNDNIPEGAEYLLALNDAQREAVCYNDGPALVIAGAGSGKTRVLVYKILHLLHSGYTASRLMALTFTNKAAREMRGRIELLAGREGRYLRMGTFHSIFLTILRRHAHRIGFGSNFTVYNTSDSKSRIKAILKLMSLDPKTYTPQGVYSRISNAKNRLLTPEAYRSHSDLIEGDIRCGMPRFAEVYARYVFEMKQSNAMDFDDLLLWTNILFRDFPEVLEEERNRIDYLLIDEYQDTNFAQFNIAYQLMQGRGNIFVVGDDAQSIYAFRGADLDNIMKFNERFAGARTFFLEQNYRSTQTIVKASSKLILNNRRQLHKTVFSKGEFGEPIALHEAYSGESEATWVLSQIEQKVREERGASYEDFAILYRTNAQSRVLEQAFRRAGVPFRIWGGRSFYSHKEIMDILAYMRLVVNPEDEEALLRIINYPKRGIGDTTITKLRIKASELSVSLSQLLPNPLSEGVELSKGTAGKLTAFASFLREMQEKAHTERDLYQYTQWLITESGIYQELSADRTAEGRSRLQNVEELLSSIESYTEDKRKQGEEAGLADYLSEVALLTDQDENEEEAGAKVTMMTIHASKGLEFPHVFIVGLEENLFPSPMSSESKDLEEERRLLYVALTRAERTCSISYALSRFRNGRTEVSKPSRFVSELPAELLRRSSTNAYASERSWGKPSQTKAHPRGLGASDTLPSTEHLSVFTAPTRSRQVYLGRRIKEEDEGEVQHQSIGDLSLGMRVRHARFGEGEILSLEGLEGNAKARVRFDTGETKLLLLRFAQLIPL